MTPVAVAVAKASVTAAQVLLPRLSADVIPEKCPALLRG
jgi:hypothetical protein